MTLGIPIPLLSMFRSFKPTCNLIYINSTTFPHTPPFTELSFSTEPKSNLFGKRNGGTKLDHLSTMGVFIKQEQLPALKKYK